MASEKATMLATLSDEQLASSIKVLTTIHNLLNDNAEDAHVLVNWLHSLWLPQSVCFQSILLYTRLTLDTLLETQCIRDLFETQCIRDGEVVAPDQPSNNEGDE